MSGIPNDLVTCRDSRNRHRKAGVGNISQRPRFNSARRVPDLSGTSKQRSPACHSPRSTLRGKSRHRGGSFLTSTGLQAHKLVPFNEAPGGPECRLGSRRHLLPWLSQ